MKNFIKKYSIKELKKDINRYGFNYSTKDFILESLAIMAIVIGIAYISHLNIEFILLLVLFVLFLIPFIIIAWFKQNYNIRKFALLSDYLSNIIPIFVQKTKIRYTLGELFEITGGMMKETIGKAIDYLDNTVNDPSLNENALRIIENDFPNSRVLSVHKLLLSIEASNSIEYEDVCANMYEDIEKWIKRVFTFQKDLKNRRGKLIFLCLATLIMNCFFVYLYVSNEYFVSFVDNKIYQISTLIFVAVLLLTITIVLTRLHGEWLINDTAYQKDETLKKKYQIYKGGRPKTKLINILSCLICIAGGAYLLLIKMIPMALFCFGLALICLFDSFLKYKRAYRIINKALTIEFPVWLREISLNLNNYTVLNAIECSQNMASYPFRKEIRKFLNEAKKDPTSVKAYNDFLSEYDLEDARSSMKVLYAIQNIGKEDVRKRISHLINRNQELLDKSETLRNTDSIGGIEALGYIPIVIFILQMLVTMLAMFGYIMNMLSGAISI